MCYLKRASISIRNRNLVLLVFIVRCGLVSDIAIVYDRHKLTATIRKLGYGTI
ncbi:hypothetical protein SDC9_183009 [bioreactor metagenome]|uniref:Uncharacterized protein n=1 Tax=bioreactor metagenome TaxID=1076179 RepID=A0A645H907_9ZZZZ